MRKVNDMGKKVVAFGEIMLRLTPPDYTTISEARNFIANWESEKYRSTLNEKK